MVKLEKVKEINSMKKWGKCFFCGGELKRKKVDIARYWGKDLIVLNDVPALVCIQCGEKYFEAKTSRKVDEKIQDALKKKTSVEKIDVPVVYF